MTDYEIMLCDAEYWAGAIGGTEFVKAVGMLGAFGRIAFLEEQYGRINRDDFFYIDESNTIVAYHAARSWFSLLIAEAEKVQ